MDDKVGAPAQRFMGKYLIGRLSDIGNSIHAYLGNDDQSFMFPLTVMEEDNGGIIKVSAACTIDDELTEEHPPHLQLFRDLYNDLMEDFISRGFKDAIHSPRILPPRFCVELSHWGYSQVPYRSDPQLFHDAYTKIIDILNTQYGVEGVQVLDDFLRDQKVVLNPLEHYTIELGKPGEVIDHLDFRVKADEHSDYTKLWELSQNIIKATEAGFGDHLTAADFGDPHRAFHYDATKAYFFIDIDIRGQTKLPGIKEILELPE